MHAGLSEDGLRLQPFRPIETTLKRITEPTETLRPVEPLQVREPAQVAALAGRKLLGQ